MSSTIRSQPAAAAASTPGLYARHSSDGNNNGRSSSSSMCSTLWVERFIDRNEKGERKKNGKKFHSTKTTRRLYCVIILDVFFSLRRFIEDPPLLTADQIWALLLRSSCWSTLDEFSSRYRNRWNSIRDNDAHAHADISQHFMDI